MKLLKYIIAICLIFTSCKTKKNIVESEKKVGKFTASEIIDRHISTKLNAETVDAKLKVDYKNSKQNLDFSVQMKIKKDEVIYLKGTKFITVFKAKITPEKVQFYSPFTKEYFDGSFNMLRKFLGVDINFNQLQNMLLGNALLNLKEQKQTIKLSENKYQIQPKKQNVNFNIFYLVNPNHFKLNKQFIISNDKELNINYPNYINKNGELFPEEINILAKEKTKNTKINMSVRSVTFNSKLNMPFKIPQGYKEIKL